MIRLVINGTPPSSNNMYENVTKRRLANGQMVGGGRRLTDEGRRFLTETKAHLAQHYPKELRTFKPNKPYFIVIRFCLTHIQNKGWAEGKTQNRYKTFDGGNLTKALEDALKDAGGVDDAQTMTSVWQKSPLQDPAAPECTIIWVWAIEEEPCPLHEQLKLLV